MSFQDPEVIGPGSRPLPPSDPPVKRQNDDGSCARCGAPAAEFVTNRDRCPTWPEVDCGRCGAYIRDLDT